MEFIYLLIVLVIAFAIHLLISIKAEQALFLTLCAFFIIMFLVGFASNLLVGYYIIIAMALISAVYIMYKAVNRQIKILDLFTPGIVFFILAFTAYYFSTQNAMVHMWDEATHWGTSAKKMYYLKELWTSGLQTIATPVFNQVMLITTGYKESALYLSQWTLYLSCIVLPMSAVKWKRSYLAAIFGAAAIFLVSSIFQSGNLTLYADGILGMIFAALLLSWHLEKKHSAKRYIWILPGIFTLVQIKNGSGASLALMLLVFMLISDAANKNENDSSKKVYLKNALTLGASIATIAISQFSLTRFDATFAGIISTAERSSTGIYTSAVFIVFLCLLAITAVLFAIYSINIFRNKNNSPAHKKLSKLLIVSSGVTFVSMISVTFYNAVLRPEFDVRTTFLNYFKAYEKYYMLKMPAMYLIAVIVVIYIVNIILSNKENRKRYIVFYCAVLFLSGAYLYGVLYAYFTSFSLGEAVNTASFDRYVGTGILFACLFALMPLVCNSDKPFKKLLLPCAPLAVCAILLAFQFNPAYKTAKVTSEEANVFRQTEIRGAEYVKSKIGNEGKVFLVIQDDQGYVFNWMRYEFTPLATNGGIWSFGLDGGWNFSWTAGQLKDFLKKASYEYLYLFKSNEHFESQFEELFGDTTPESGNLYKFNYESDIVFELVE